MIDWSTAKAQTTDRFRAYLYNYAGKKAVTKAEKEELKDLAKKGLLLKTTIDPIKDMFNLGVAATMFGQAVVKKWGKVELRQFDLIQDPLSTAEQSALDFIRAESEDRLTNLFSNITADIQNTYNTRIIGGRQFMEHVREGLKQKIEERKTMRQLASDIGHKTQAWSRDLYRIAFTESHNAYSFGVALAGIKKAGKSAEDLYVSKLPRGRGISCEDCLKLYLKPKTDEPKVFKLADIIGNSNVKVKRKDWKPVVGSTHPFCACNLVFVNPATQEWSDHYRAFVFKKPVKV